MHLPDAWRHTVAGLVSGASFLGFFAGLTLQWWLSLVLALVVYGAMLLVIRRRPGLDEISAGPGTSAADLRAAGQAMARAADRLEASLGKLPAGDAEVVTQLAGHVRSIGAHVATDPQDYRRTRRFVGSYLGHMVETVEGFAELTSKSRGRHEARLRPMSERIAGYLPVLERIDAACLENDFTALEAQMSALSYQMERG